MGIDIDDDSLEKALYDCNPGASVYIAKRKYPLEIYIIKGSILNPIDLIPFQISAITLCEV